MKTKKRRLEHWWLPLWIGLIWTILSLALWWSWSSFKNQWNNGIYNQAIINADASSVNIHYNSLPDDDRIQNERSQILTEVNPNEIVQTYFDLLNNWNIKDACSLLNISLCDTKNNNSVIALWREKQNLQNWYENLEIIDASMWTDTKRIMCVKFSYMLNANSKWRLWYFYQYHIEKREWVREITNRIPEKKFQEWYGEQHLSTSASEIICHWNIMS